MKRHRDRHDHHRDDDSDRRGQGGPLRGRYARDNDAGRAEGVHWEPDSHLPGSGPAGEDGRSGGAQGTSGGAGADDDDAQRPEDHGVEHDRQDEPARKKAVEQRALEAQMHEPAHHDHELEEGEDDEQRHVDAAQLQRPIDVEEGDFDGRQHPEQGGDLPVLADARMRRMVPWRGLSVAGHICP